MSGRLETAAVGLGRWTAGMIGLVGLLISFLMFGPAALAQAPAGESGPPALRTVFQAGHEGQVGGLAFNADETLLASVDYKGNIKVWEMPSARLLQSFRNPDVEPLWDFDEFAFTTTGRLMLMLEDKKFEYDPITGRLQAPGPAFKLVPAKAKGMQEVDLKSPKGTYRIKVLCPFEGSGGYYPGCAFNLTVVKRKKTTPFFSGGYRVDRMAFSGDGSMIALNEEILGGEDELAGRVSLIRLDQGGQSQVLTSVDGNRYTSITFSPDGRFLASLLAYDNTIHVWDIQTLEQKDIDTPNGRFAQGVTFSPDGRVLALMTAHREDDDQGGSYQILILRRADGGLEQKMDMPANVGNDLAAAFSPDGRRLAMLVRTFDPVDEAPESQDPPAGGPPPAGSGEAPADETGGETPPGAADKFEIRLMVWDLGAGRAIQDALVEVIPPGKDEPSIRRFEFSADGKKIHVNNDLWDPETGRKAAEPAPLPARPAPPGGIQSADGRLRIQPTTDQRGIELWDLSQGVRRASLYNAGDSTLIVTPEGFFSGQGRFDRHVHFVHGGRAYDFNRFYDAFYRPDLVEKKLKGVDIRPFVGSLNLAEALASPPPDVAILSPQDMAAVTKRRVQVKLKVEDRGGGIGDVRLYHNGKLVRSRGVYRVAREETGSGAEAQVGSAGGSPYQTAQRSIDFLQVEPLGLGTRTKAPPPAGPLVETTYELDLVQGPNTLAAAAFNGSNTVMSALRSIDLMAKVPAVKPRLFVLSSGHDHFANPRFALAFPVKDARDFSRLMDQEARKVFNQAEVVTLTDATKEGITTALRDMAGRMTAEDVFVLFVASHGLAEDDLYYLIASDFDGRRGNLPKAAISSVELMEWSKTIPALRQIYVLDTCHSGGLGAVVAGLYDARVSVLAKALGMHVLAAAQLKQKAADRYENNGLFTHFVLKGLSGDADTNQDRAVSVMELTPYLAKWVKKASAGGQEAFIRNFGDDLNLVKVE